MISFFQILYIKRKLKNNQKLLKKSLEFLQLDREKIFNEFNVKMDKLKELVNN